MMAAGASVQAPPVPVVVAAVGLWLPVVVIAVAIAAAVAWEIALAKRVLRKGTVAEEPTPPEEPTPSPDSAATATTATAATATASEKEAAGSATRRAVSETVRSVLATLEGRRLGRDEADLLIDAVAAEVSASVGPDLALDTDGLARLDAALREELGRELTGAHDPDQPVSVTG